MAEEIKCLRDRFASGVSQFKCPKCQKCHHKYFHKRLFELTPWEKYKIIKIFCRECHDWVYSSEAQMLHSNDQYPRIYYEEIFRPYKK
jgi:hypothetical protein